MDQVPVAAAHTFSIWGLVMQADPVVKTVMALLVLGSVFCWAIVFEKAIRLFALRRDLKRVENAAYSDHVQGSEITGLARELVSAAQREAEEGASRNEDRNDVRARIERAMKIAFKTRLHSVEQGLPFLATIGSAGPFIGLFGTVWGIMNSFTSIAQQKDTSLAVVAPGIAEALFATALGLGAAIPAVMAYNAIAVSMGRMASRGNTAISELAKRLSRPHVDAALSHPNVEPLRAGKHS